MITVIVGEIIARMGLDTSAFDRGLDDSKKKGQGLVSTISGIFKQGLSFATGLGIFEMLKAGFNSTVKAGWDLTQTLQTARIGFTTMMGAADEANQHIRDMMQFAAKTPFQFEGLIAASQQMQGMGINAERVIPILSGIGDALAASGKMSQEAVGRATLALGQMSLRGKVASQEMMQLTEAGIPGWTILAEKMGVSTERLQEMVSKGMVPASAAIDALAVGLTERFGGSMDKISKEVPGMWSTIKDNIQMLMSEAVQPAYDFLQNKVLPWVLDFTERLSGFSLSKITAEVQGLVSGLGISSESLKGMWDSIVSAVHSTWNTVKDVVSAACEIARSVVSTAWGAIRDVVEWVMKHIAPFVIEQWNRIANFIREILPDIVAVIKGILGALKGWWDQYWPAIAAVVTPIWNAIAWVVENVLTVIMGVIKTALKVIQGDWSGAWAAIHDMFADIWGSIASIAFQAWTAIKEKLYGWLGSLMDIIRPFLKILPDSWEAVWDDWRDTVEQKRIDNEVALQFQRIKETIDESTASATEDVGNFAAQVQAALSQAPATVDAVAQSFDGLAASAKAAGDAVETAVKKAMTRSELVSYANQRAVEMQYERGTIVGGASDLMDALKKKTPNYEGNVRAIAEAANVDMGVAEAMLRSHLLQQYRDGLIKLAAGGIVTRPTIALVGEAGPEAVVPLNRGTLPATINITITGNHIASDYDVDRIGEQLVRRLRLAGVIG